MPRIGLAFRYISLWLLLSAIPALVALAALPLARAICLALVLGSLALVLLAAAGERVLERALGTRRPECLAASQAARHGLSRTVQQTFRGKVQYPAPQVSIFLDPFPAAIFSRGWGSPGRIFLSAGSLDILSESELRALLLRSVTRCREPGGPLRSACAVLSLGISKLTPRRLTPGAWILFAMNSSILALLQRIGAGNEDPKARPQTLPQPLIDALQKLERSPRSLELLAVR